MQLVKGFQEMQQGADRSPETDSEVEPVTQPEIEVEADTEPEPEAIGDDAREFGGIQDGLDDVLEELLALHEEIATANQLAAQQRETIIHLLKQQVEADAQEAVGEALAKISQDILGGSQHQRVLGSTNKSLATTGPRRSNKPKTDAVLEAPAKPSQGVDESFREVPSEELKLMNNRGVAQEKLRRAFQALKVYNDAPERTRQQKWRINQSVLQQFTGCNIPAVRDFRLAHADEIKAHNTHHDLSPRHNLTHSRNNQDINDFVHW